ncbi:DUF1254 domain-containing protein [Nocardia sp. NPDC060249]|uniref:DUF1254 domain-containing protein n=1 Tax=Nocardia sp. NPDC060249 TaxID=3347082 RepID=UPI00364B5045
MTQVESARWSEFAGIEPDGNYLSDDDRQRLLEEYFFQRAVQVYLQALPIVNVIALRDGSHGRWGGGYNVLPIWKQRMDSACRVPTPNADVIYAMSYLDLAADGPLVIAAPPGILGMLTDFWQHALSDVGLAGPDQGKGGQYLLVPPGYDGPPLPGGYHVLHSPTYNVFLFWRAFLTSGDEGPETATGVAALEQTVIHPLYQSNPATWKPMQFPDASGERVDMLFPRDAGFFDLLAGFVDYEPVDAIDLRLRGMMASIGIRKGEPFEPDARHREILDAAARLAPQLAVALSTTPDSYPGRRYYTGAEKRHWLNGFPDVDENFNAGTYLSLDHQATFFTVAYSASPAMALNIIGGGAKYPSTFWDADGEYLTGANHYRLRLPPNPPARLFWAVTLYNPVDGTMITVDGHPIPSVNSLDKRVTANADGSYDIYTGPSKPADSTDANWIPTNPDEGFLLTLRLYGPTRAFFDQTWIPDDVERVNP